MQRSYLIRHLLTYLAVAAWVFALLAIGSFHAEDWPSHEVAEYAATPLNLCGKAGAFVAYWLFFVLGQGVFPILFFSGVCLALYLMKNRVTDLWFRVIGLLLLSVAFASAVHLLRPGTQSGFPEGHGGVIGISAAYYLRSHFNPVGTGLVLLVTFLVGLVLAADDLMVQAPAWVGHAVHSLREHTPGFRLHLPAIVSRSAQAASSAVANAAAKLKARPATPSNTNSESDDEPLKMPVLLRENATDLADHSARMARQEKLAQPSSPSVPDGQEIDLAYETDEAVPAAQDVAYTDEADPEPSLPATIPPPEEQVVPKAPEPKREILVRLPNMMKPRQVSPPPAPPKELGEYHLPPWDTLADAEYGYAASQEAFVREKAVVLERTLHDFNIDAHVVEIDTGPVITMYEISLAPGIKVSQITALSNDMARALMAVNVRIVAPVPGKDTVGIEVPNAQKEKVRLKELMQLAPDATRKMAIPLFLGKDASGEPLVTDLAAMPHCLIAGTTGSGKSVCINTIILSIMYMQRPDRVKLILFDPKVVEMAAFKDIPHLMCPVINETGRAASVLEWACEKMDERYEMLAEAGVRNITGYNKLTPEELAERFKPGSPEEEAKIPKHLPYIVIIIDELADLMMTSGKEVEAAIVRLAQKSRAVGIHLILATQRPQATVVTGLIKANMPSRIAFRVASKMDSRIVLDQNGADLLLGQGDMLFLPPGSSKPIRSQGTFVEDKEIRESVKLLKSLAEAQYEPELVQIRAAVGEPGETEKDELFDDAVRVVLETKRGSVSLLQRRLTIGYSRASRLIEQMAAAGIVGDYKGSQAREATITIEEWEAMKAQQQADADSGMSV